MPWRLVGWIAALLFAALAVPATATPDAPLPMIVLVAAAISALAVARGQTVARWVTIVLVVFPAELALMTVLFEVPDAPLPSGWVAWAPRPVAVEAASLFLVAGWATALLFGRPNDPET